MSVVYMSHSNVPNVMDIVTYHMAQNLGDFDKFLDQSVLIVKRLTEVARRKVVNGP